MSKWQPIETAPRDGTPLLLYIPGVQFWNRVMGMPDMVVGLWRKKELLWGGGWVSDIGYVEEGYECTYFEHEPLSPTHWMPLPAPPR